MSPKRHRFGHCGIQFRRTWVENQLFVGRGRNTVTGPPPESET